jgi:hypothetical protein
VEPIRTPFAGEIGRVLQGNNDWGGLDGLDMPLGILPVLSLYEGPKIFMTLKALQQREAILAVYIIFAGF